MVGPGARSLFLAVLSAAVALAGCFGGDDGAKPDASGGAPAPGDDAEGSPDEADGDAHEPAPEEEGCAFEFCLEGHVYAPGWALGMTWTYRVTGPFFPGEYETTVGVFQVAEDHYKLGSGADDELENAVTWDSVMVGPVQKDSFAVLKGGEYQDLLGFRKIGGTSWELKELYQSDWTLNKSASKEVTWLGGTSLGFRVEGISDRGEFLRIEYASDAKWITLFEWLDRSGNPLVRYELQDAGAGDTSAFRYWTRGAYAVAVPLASTPLGVAQWTSDGTASFMLLRFITPAGVLGQGRVIDPGLKVVEAQHSPGSAVQVLDVITPDAAGRWIATIVTDRGGTVASGSPAMNIWMLQVRETTAT